ncbi:hypothetical protein Pla108_16130 [Botrimarina colliarenosi]|uniref:Uncharacterized protein n=1 Tax=Botrimarina colliarenosi TaxID=2528001 RepID=A0A5C6AMM0_9BACT|nr:hypothetical protein Pla108_16130 [Botrimarina colliarenosi]
MGRGAKKHGPGFPKEARPVSLFTLCSDWCSYELSCSRSRQPAPGRNRRNRQRRGR